MGNFDIPICKQKSRETLFYSIALLNFEYWESMPLCAMSNSQTLLPSCQVMLATLMFLTPLSLAGFVSGGTLRCSGIFSRGFRHENIGVLYTI